MIDDVNLVEEDARVEDVEGRVIDGSREYDVFQELQAVGMVDLPLDGFVSDVDRLVVAGCLAEEIAVIGFVGGKLGVVCEIRLEDSY